ncbi:MAG: hypothetical protein EXS36_03355 [Pedosphaera sp.]|nr:hypothetical protein [Pedosphaera sp.]
MSTLLRDWDYVPGHVVARRFKGRDGRERIQLRVDLGILQMHAEGRPDGKRPLGHESWLECFKARLEKSQTEVGSEEGRFELKPEDCSRLQQEAIQYHHRYICLFQLEDYDAVVRDADRNEDACEFATAFAASDELGWSLNQFLPQTLMMRTRAVGTKALKAGQHEAAIHLIEDGIGTLDDFYREHGREDLMESSGELASLRQWLQEMRSRKPLSELEKLQDQLSEAIRLEDYERAARVRDQLRKMEEP